MLYNFSSSCSAAFEGERVIKGQLLDFCDERSDESADATIVRVLFFVLKVLAVYDSQFSLIGLHFSIIEINIFDTFTNGVLLYAFSIIIVHEIIQNQAANCHF